MVRFNLHGREGHPQPPDEAAEDVTVRQYRFLLRTAPADALEAAHTEALPLLSPDERRSLLRAIQESLLVGGHLGDSDHSHIAHLIAAGERRSPGQLLTALPPPVLEHLAGRVLDAEASFGLFGGYAQWDGVDPAPEDDAPWADHGFTKRSHAHGGGVDPTGLERGIGDG